MAELCGAGVRGTALDVVSAWKEVLLAVGLVLVYARTALALPPGARRLARARLRRRRRRLRADPAARRSAAARPTTASCSASATTRSRSPRTSSGAGSTSACATRAVSGATILASASAVAAFGLVDIYAIPLSWWRSSGAPGWFSKQLGFAYTGPLGAARRTSSTTRATSIRCGGSSRRSSRRSRRRTCS